MSNHNLPNLQPGQRIIVRHHNDGSTEYICRRDSSLDFASGEGSVRGLTNLFWLVALLVFIWYMLPDSQAEQTRKKMEFHQKQIKIADTE